MGTIQTAGETCRSALEDLTDAEQHRHDFKEQQTESHLLRFNLWASDFGLFKEQPFSIDYKLRKNDLVKAIVQDILHAIVQNARFCEKQLLERSTLHDPGTSPAGTAFPPKARAHVEVQRGTFQERSQSSIRTEISFISPTGLDPPESVPRSHDVETTSDHQIPVLEKSTENSPQELTKAHDRISDGLSRLVILSRSIKVFQRDHTEAVADRYDPKGPEGELQFPEFGQHVEFILEQCYVQRDNYLRTRLRNTIITRWRRLSYYVARSMATADITKASPVPMDTVQEANSTVQTQQRSYNREHGQSVLNEKVVRQQLPTRHSTKSAVTESVTRTVDSGFIPNTIHDEPTPLFNPRSLLGTKRSEFPAPPAVLGRGTDFKCPLCGVLQPTTMLDTKAWQSHVMHDLAPYICFYEKCSSPENMYHSSEEWKQHMSQDHVQRCWTCRECLQDFTSEADYKAHIPKTHSLNPSDAHSSLLARMNEIRRPAVVFAECLVCGTDDMEDQNIELHVAEHLRQFALVSLPWNLTGAIRSNVSDKSHANDSSVIRMDEFVKHSGSVRWDRDSDLPKEISSSSGITAGQLKSFSPGIDIGRKEQWIYAAAEVVEFTGYDASEAWQSYAIGDIVFDASDVAMSPLYIIETHHLLLGHAGRPDPSLQLYRLGNSAGKPHEDKWLPHQLLLSSPQTNEYPALSDETPTRYTYEPLPTARSIRILQLRPSSYYNEFIECSVTTTILDGDQAPMPYEAVSHSWETRYYTREIRLDGRSINVTENLYYGLKRLRGEERVRSLWIDAICINMADMRERANQVQMMHLIFGSATAVVAWLGEGTLDPEPLLPTSTKTSPDIPRSGEVEQMIFSFVQATLFKRRWVVQEFAVARSVILVLGNRTVPWLDIARGLQTAIVSLERVSIAGLSRSRDMALEVRQALERFKRLAWIAEVGHRRGEEGEYNSANAGLETLVSTFADFEVTLPHDAIYALRSIAREVLSPRRSELEPPLPDYSKSTQHVFAEFVSWAIASSGSLDIVCRPWAMPLDGLPSWIRPFLPPSHDVVNDLLINFRPSPTQTNEMPSWMRPSPYPLIGDPGKARYNASAGLSASTYEERTLLHITEDGSISEPQSPGTGPDTYIVDYELDGTEDFSGRMDNQPHTVTSPIGAAVSSGKSSERRSYKREQAFSSVAQDPNRPRKNLKIAGSPTMTPNRVENPYAHVGQDGISLIVRGWVISIIKQQSAVIYDTLEQDALAILELWDHETQWKLLTADRNLSNQDESNVSFPAAWTYCKERRTAEERPRIVLLAYSPSQEEYVTRLSPNSRDDNVQPQASRSWE